MSTNQKTVIRVHPTTYDKLKRLRNKMNYIDEKDFSSMGAVIEYLLDQTTE